MLLRMLFSRKYRVSKRVRFEVGVDVLRELFSDWWLLILSLVLVAISLPLVLGFRLIEPESARWTLSALVQAGAALIGIFFVALSLLWNQATREREKLRGLMEFYMGVFSKEAEADKEIRGTLSELSRSRDCADDIRGMIVDCSKRLVVLEYARTLYSYSTSVTPHELLLQANTYGLPINKKMENEVRNKATQLSYSEIAFFNYLLLFGDKLSELSRELQLESRGSRHLSEALWRARRVDTVGMSLNRINFFNRFVGKGLKIVSLMWLLCLTIGLLLLVSLDRIPNHILPCLTSATVAIGVAALGMTLSLVFRAVRSSG